MTNPSNRDLQIILVRMESGLASALEKIDEFKKTQARHEEKDEEQFDRLNTSVNNMHKYAASIAGVAAFIGAGITASIDWIKK